MMVVACGNLLRHGRLFAALHLTGKGKGMLDDIGRVAREHDAAVICAALNEKEREELAALGRIAEEQGLTRGIHPGFKRLGRSK